MKVNEQSLVNVCSIKVFEFARYAFNRFMYFVMGLFLCIFLCFHMCFCLKIPVYCKVVMFEICLQVRWSKCSPGE